MARYSPRFGMFLSSHQQALAEQRLAGQMMPTPETATASSGPSTNLILLYTGIGALAGNFLMRGSPLAIGGGGIAGYFVAQGQHQMEVKKAQAATEAARTQQTGAIMGPTSCPPGQRLAMTFPATCVPAAQSGPITGGGVHPPPAPSISPECRQCRDQFPTTQFAMPSMQSPAGLAPAEIATWEKCRDQQCFPSFANVIASFTSQVL